MLNIGLLVGAGAALIFYVKRRRTRKTVVD